MNKIFSAICLFLCIILKFAASKECACAKDTLSAEYGDIIYAGLIFRHGNRVPEKVYPTDPYQNYSWPFELGQLVNEGKQRAYRLGKFFRPRYIHLVGNSFTPSKVITHASGYDRTLMSGLLFNAGFFPPIGNEVWNDELQWQPIPIHSSPADIDNVLRLTKPCPRLEQLKVDYYENGETIRSICTQYRDEISYIERYSGLNITPCRNKDNIFNLVFVQDALLIETEQNLTLPEWTKRVYPEPLHTFRASLLQAEADDPRVRRFLAGPFLNVIVSDILNVAGLKNTQPKNIYTSEPSQTPRLHLFAAHDNNVIILLKTLGVYKNQAPNYSAAIGFELRKKADQFYVTVIYENSLEEKPQVLQIPYCNGICTLQQFLSLVTPVIPEDFDAECAMRYSVPTENFPKINGLYFPYLTHPIQVPQ